jgi:hypothetical protein
MPVPPRGHILVLKRTYSTASLCGFTAVPGKAAFSWALGFLSEQGILERTLDGIVSMAHKGLMVYHVNRDSTAIPAREGVVKKREEKVSKRGRKRGIWRSSWRGRSWNGQGARCGY